MNRPTDTEIDTLIKVVTLCCRIVVRIGIAIRRYESVDENMISSDIKSTLKRIK